MLIACDSCARQYDVGLFPPGTRVRCYCGDLNTVPEPQARDLPMQRCSSCGGELAHGSKHCGYCEAAIEIAERGWGDSCPQCYARLIKGAKFCSACGVAIRPQLIKKRSRSERCPRCEGDLAVCEIEGGSFTECVGCGGVWLEERAFERLSLQTEEQSAVASYFEQRHDKTQALPNDPRVHEKNFKYLSCPMCQTIMHRKNFALASGVIIDWCKGHGYWFDTHELERIVNFIGEGGLEKARRRQIERSKQEEQRAKESAAFARRMSARGGTDPYFQGAPVFYRTQSVGLLDVLFSILRSL